MSRSRWLLVCSSSLRLFTGRVGRLGSLLDCSRMDIEHACGVLAVDGKGKPAVGYRVWNLWG